MDISVANTKLQRPMVCYPQEDDMQTYVGPAWQVTFHDHCVHSVVSHPNSKQDKSKEGEEKARGRTESGGRARPLAEK